MSSIFRTKSIEASVAETEEAEYHLKKRLSALDLTVFGIGVIIGAGIFTLTGRAAATVAGPSIVLSFVIAAVACGLAALCYAEFASTVPVSGSAYTFSYATLGEFVAWIIGWDLLLEMLLGAGVVAQGWSAYLGVFLQHLGITLPPSHLVRVALRPVRLPARPCSHGARQHRHQGVDAGQPGPRGAEAVRRLLRHHRRHRLHQHRELHPVHPAGPAAHGQRRLLDRPPAAVDLRVHPEQLRGHGDLRRGVAGLLRLHRVRRRRDDCGGGAQPAARPAHRHHRLSRHLHDPLRGRHPRHHRHAAVQPDLPRRRRSPRRSSRWARAATRPSSAPGRWPVSRPSS